MAAKKPAPVATPQPTPRRKAAPRDTEVQMTHSDAVDVPSTQVALKRPAGGSLTMTDRLKAMAVRQREEVAKAPAATGNMISFRGGSMTLNDRPLGNALPIILLAAQFERSYYPGAFNPGEAVVPSCYSRDNITPHESAAFPQNETCKDCQWNQFETAREGTGKGCKEGLKLAVVHAEQVADPKQTPVIAQCRLSVLNAKLVRQDLQGVLANPNIDHSVQAVLTLTCVPDAKSQYKAGLVFEGYSPADVVERLEPLLEQAELLLQESYPASMAIDPKEAAAKSGKSARAVKRF